MRDTDEDWKKIAETDPYWGVVSSEEFRAGQINDESLAKFFAGGEQWIGNVFALIRAHLPGGFEPKRSLDFGCGVGRLLAPIARRSKEAVGVDVAPRMLELCAEHLRRFGIDNATLVAGDDALSGLTGAFDFINSYIVMQHIPPARGMEILRRLLELLAVGGTASIQLTYAKARVFFPHEGAQAHFYRRDGDRIVDLVPTARSEGVGAIKMFDYDLNEVFATVSTVTGTPVIVLPTNHDNHVGVHLVFRKAREFAFNAVRPASSAAASANPATPATVAARAAEAARRARIKAFRERPVSFLPADGRAAQRFALTAANPRVSIILPVYGQRALVRECLLSLEASGEDPESYEVIIADDASPEDIGSLKDEFPAIRYVRNPENLGHLRNCNKALALARGQEVLFLNSDVQVSPGFLGRMLALLDSDPKIGVIGPKLVYPNGRLQEAGCRINTDGSSNLIGVWDDPDAPEYCRSGDVDYCSAACLLVRGRLLKELGGFDERFAPSYCEDADLCFAARSAGWRVVYCAEVTILHHQSASHNAVDRSFKLELSRANHRKLVEKWSREIQRLQDSRTRPAGLAAGST